MELKPHDLLEIRSHHDLISYSPLPDWAKESLSYSPFVVIRRALSPEGQIAVGVRGNTRSERFAAFLPIDRIMQRIAPEDIGEKKEWKQHSQYRNMEIYKCLEELSNYLEALGLIWGPTGSIGFELASGRNVVKNTSDIDLLIRSHAKMPRKTAEQLHFFIKKRKIRVDVQVEAALGAFALEEYAKGISPLLIRTMNGPVLLDDPWGKSVSEISELNKSNNNIKV